MTIREFENYFRLLYLPLGMYAMRIVEDVDDAEDIVSDAFAKAWLAVSDDKQIDSFKAYMYRAVHNACISFVRAKHEYVTLEEFPEVTDEKVDTSERDAAIWKALEALPEKCRMIFLMSKRDGMSNEQIAQELGISLSTVKNQMSKAFSRLREALSDGHRPFFLPFL